MFILEDVLDFIAGAVGIILTPVALIVRMIDRAWKVAMQLSGTFF